jgi:deazaflavin-dependent oxidoreductase (nitroreductase family)
MANWQWFTKLHRSAYRASGGRIGARLAGLDMLLLTSMGRTSGLERTIPLACFRNGDDWIVVASNNGQDRHPGWYFNLQKNPEARVRIGREERRVRAIVAEGEERAGLWPRLRQENPMYAKYEQKTKREIPVVILRFADAR